MTLTEDLTFCLPLAGLYSVEMQRNALREERPTLGPGLAVVCRQVPAENLTCWFTTLLHVHHNAMTGRTGILCCFPLLFRAFFTLLSSKICRNDQRWLCCFGKPVAQNCRQERMYMSGLHARVHA